MKNLIMNLPKLCTKLGRNRATYMLSENRKFLKEYGFWRDYEDVAYTIYSLERRGEKTIMPTHFGLLILVWYYRNIMSWYECLNSALCSHPNMIDESYGGPETGCMAGSCPDCGFAFHTTMY